MCLTFHLIIKEVVLKTKVMHLVVTLWENKSSIAFIDAMSENFRDKNVHLKLSLLFAIRRNKSRFQGELS